MDFSDESRRIRFSAAVAVAIVLVCYAIVGGDREFVAPAPIASPSVSIVGATVPVERGISASFFLPTGRNVRQSVQMPTLSCAVDVDDIGHIQVFRAGDRGRIVAALDPFQETVAPNILDGVVIAEMRPPPIRWDGLILEDMLSGERSAIQPPDGFACEGSILCHGSDGIGFVLPEEAAMLGDGIIPRDDCVKFFAVKGREDSNDFDRP